jgi:hypothetical protein
LFHQKKLFEKFHVEKSYVKGIKNRLLPGMLIWGAGTGPVPNASLSKAQMPDTCFYIGLGENPVAVMRSSWLDDAIYLGFKVGKPGYFHGHMDVGTFQLEAGGVRWAIDLGSDEYNDIERSGIQLFDMSQNSDRWTQLLKYNNKSHNTLTLNGAYQLVDRKADFTDYSSHPDSMSITGDLTPVYEQQAASVIRSVRLVNKHSIVVEDSITARYSGTTVVWNMTTMAESMTYDQNRNIINLEGKDMNGRVRQLRIQIRPGYSQPIKNMSVDFSKVIPKHSFEGKNDGVHFVRFQYQLDTGKPQTIQYVMSLL